MRQQQLTPARMEAFSDGVIAVIITIMVLDLRVPSHQLVSGDFAALRLTLKPLLFYLLSFVQVGIYWVNHHYMLDDLEAVDHPVLWANLVFLFCLSLFPFATSFVAQRGIAGPTVALYAVISVLPSLSWTVVSTLIRRRTVKPPINSRGKEMFSLALYSGAIFIAFFAPYVAIAMLVTVACIWLMPPTRILHEQCDAPVSDTSASR